MKKLLEKEDVFDFKYSSTVSDKEINNLLKQQVYATKNEWRKFVELFLFVLGSGSFVFGVIFFFAFNWNLLDSFTKFATIGILLCISVFLSVYPKLKSIYKQIALLISTMLVGVLYAVFGQEYQTGANAYDFFLAWLMSVTIWTLASKSALQWTLFGLLANTTLCFYFNQTNHYLNFSYILQAFIVLNCIVFYLPLGINKFIKPLSIPQWYKHTGTSVLNVLITSFIIYSYFRLRSNDFSTLSLAAIISIIFLLACGIWIFVMYKFSNIHRQFYTFCLTLLSLYFIVFAILIDLIGFHEVGFLIYSIYLLGGSVFLIRYLVATFKLWKNERR